MTFNVAAFVDTIGRMTEDETQKALEILVEHMQLHKVVEGLKGALDADDQLELGAHFEDDD